ncbi:hypothetical protein RhiirA1_542569 [Rhizophagus irregularis]|uniref:Uncharacterized protein n=1 Tax=Rhizophagus irregularis TaxID=588596 RepID=A0A2N0QW80_9GLOM|nr:hypothetical protein RhiirA1_542569 [Rhizophagus irregularis]
MSSELELSKQRITELEAENVEIAELRKENAELRKENTDFRMKFANFEAERAELKRRIAETLRMTEEERTRRDAENAKLKARIKELESEFRDRLTKVEQNQSLIDNSSNNTSSNFNLVAEPTVTQHEKPLVNEEMDTSLPEEPIPEVIAKPSVSAFNIPIMDQCDQKSLEDKETDAFLDEEHKKKVSDEIRQRNREKKLLHESANQEASSFSQDISSHGSLGKSEKNGNSVTFRDDRQKIIPAITTSQENNDDDDTELTKSQVIEQELTKELLSSIITAPSISFETTEQISSVTHPSSSSLDTTQNLVLLFQNAIQAGHKVILSWLYYSNSFENKVDEIRHGTGASDKTARSQLYQEMLKHLPATTLGNLRMRTLRAKKIRMLFGEGGVGVDKIKQVTFSVYEISSLTINQIQSVIKNVTSAGRTPEVPNRNQMTSALPIVTDQINSPLISAEVTTSHPQIPITNPTYDQSYFRNKILDQYPNLYREETGCEPWQLSEAVINTSAKPQASDFKPITFEVKPDPELIIKSILKHFTYLKFRNSFRGIDNYNFASPQPWSSPCPICDGIHGNYGLHGSWYCENGNQLPYDPELAKLYSQDKLEYCLTCNTSSNKLKFAIVA